MSNVQLLPLTAEDIPQIHEISVGGLSKRCPHAVQRLGEKRGDIHDIDDELSTPALPSFIAADANGKGKTFKAVVDGKIKGWVSWGFYNLAGDLQRVSRASYAESRALYPHGQALQIHGGTCADIS